MSPRRAVPQKASCGVPAPGKQLILGARANKPALLPSMGPEKGALWGTARRSATPKTHSQHGIPALGPSDGPTKRTPVYQVLHMRARALKNGGNDAIVYVKGNLRCILRTGGDLEVQGDVSGRLAWVPSAIWVAPVHAQSVRLHLAAAGAKAARWLKRLPSPGLSARIISG